MIRCPSVAARLFGKSLAFDTARRYPREDQIDVLVALLQLGALSWIDFEVSP